MKKAETEKLKITYRQIVIKNKKAYDRKKIRKISD